MAEKFNVIEKHVPTFYFIGVTTGKSSIMKVFPLWMDVLGRSEIVIEGVDCKIHDSPAAYRAATAQIKYDANSLGALVTTHKVDLYEATRDMFAYLDPYAQQLGELSGISKNEGRLEGHAKDPISAGLSLDAILPAGYFGRTGGEVLIFGAGGSSAATLLHLINKKDAADRPKRFIIVNRSEKRLTNIHAMVDELDTDIQIEYICNQDPVKNDTILAERPPYSVIINATGMGKDTPGSPITGAAPFPLNAIAWEFNYRGELDFMHQALAQVKSRSVKVEDGWLYFVHGWTQVIAQALHVDLTPEVFTRLESAAAAVRQKS